MDESPLVARLQQLAELYRVGALSAEEFAAAKAEVIGSHGGQQPPMPAASNSPAPEPGAESGGPRWWERSAQATPQAPAAGRATPPAAPTPSSTEPSWGSPESSTGPQQVRPPTDAGGPQLPQVPVGVSQPPAGPTGRGGPIGVGLAGLGVLVAFFAVPLTRLPFIGPLTSAEATRFSSELAVLGLLWVAPLAALGMIGLACYLIVAVPSQPRRRVCSSTAAVLAGLVVAVYVVLLVAVEAERSGAGRGGPSVTGAGFWIAILAAGAGGAAAWYDLGRSPRGAGPSPHGPPSQRVGPGH